MTRLACYVLAYPARKVTYNRHCMNSVDCTVFRSKCFHHNSNYVKVCQTGTRNLPFSENGKVGIQCSVWTVNVSVTGILHFPLLTFMTTEQGLAKYCLSAVVINRSSKLSVLRYIKQLFYTLYELLPRICV